ncbi:hypothetical protein [Nocardia lijiangensis]|uniref:hypothetical protein n=1 Tax=Nocardia lijiangensis TaxID=299618 RepID=UPI0008322F5D|nr:hypothetical protein [Nocardia lijiangensis]
MSESRSKSDAKRIGGQSGQDSIQYVREPVASRLRDGPVIDLPPLPPRPATWLPDFALQVRNPYQLPLGCVSAGLEQPLIDGIRSALAAEYPQADIQLGCVQHGDRSATTVGVWTTPPPTDAAKDARQRGLESVDILLDDETLGIWVNPSFIRQLVSAEFARNPKRYNSYGTPDPGGSVHITGYELQFMAPDRVVTKIRGYDDRPWPDVSFTITVTDTLTVAGFGIGCTSATELDTHETWANVLTSVLVVALLPLVAPIPGSIGIFETTFGTSRPPNIGGPGCVIAENFFIDEALLPLGLKAIALYNRVRVSSIGMIAAGTFDLAGREPEVWIAGPRNLVVAGPATGATYTIPYGVVGQELRGDDGLSIVWTANGGTIVNQGMKQTTVVWTGITGVVGDVVERTLDVEVSDIDGLSASTTLVVEIKIVDPNEEDTICLKKPWLPKCRGG